MTGDDVFGSRGDEDELEHLGAFRLLEVVIVTSISSGGYFARLPADSAIKG